MLLQSNLQLESILKSILQRQIRIRSDNSNIMVATASLCAGLGQATALTGKALKQQKRTVAKPAAGRQVRNLFGSFGFQNQKWLSCQCASYSQPDTRG